VSRHVLDSSALLAWIHDESGAEVVADVLEESVIGAVNLAEVAAKLADSGYEDAAVRRTLERARVEVIPLSATTAESSGLLRPITRTAGLSLGDRACLALAIELDLPALTADRRWKHLRTRATVELIR
jgi:PIN domain nuclease of toxin-antitoxin system